jgi:hypothetical protein
MEYVHASASGQEVLYAGSFCGRLHAFLLTTSLTHSHTRHKVPRSLRPEDISRDMCHAGEITCLLHR